MWLTIAWFEFGQRLKRLSTWIYFTLFLAMGVLLFLAAAGAFQNVGGFGTGGKVTANSPHTLAGLIGTISYFALLVTAALFGQAVHQDFGHGTYPLLFTAPLSKSSYLGGRLLGVLAVLVLIQGATGLGCFVGSLLPFNDAKLIGPHRAMSYLGPYLLIVLPNLLILGPLFFALGALTRKMRAVYVTAVVLLIGYLLAGTLSQKLEHRPLAALLDPFGSYAFERLTEYWTPAEKNSRQIPLQGVMLWNRLIWLAVGAAALALTFWRFRLAEPLVRERKPGRPEGKDLAAAGPALTLAPARRPGAWRLLRGLTWLAFRETVKNVYFLVIALAGVLFVITAARLMDMLGGTPTYPVTRSMIEVGGGAFEMLFIPIIVVIFAGELVWRERDARIDQIVDALPVSTWLLALSRLGALLLVGLLLQLLVMACGIGLQIASGYYRFQLPLYLFDLLGLRMVGFFQLAALALFVQVLVNHKHLGHFVMVLYFAAKALLNVFGFSHRLYRYGSAPDYAYSDMNGYGHFLRAWGWFNLYWSLGALILVVLAVWLWPRGQDTGLRQRLALARQRSAGAPRWLLAAILAGFAGTGGFIYYNTNVLNQYQSRADLQREQVDYERLYKKHQDEPQPRVTDVQVHFDIWPERNAVRMTGRFQLTNRNPVPVRTVYLNLASHTKIHRLAVAGVAKPTRADDRLEFYAYELPVPLAPEASISLEFDLERAPRGFTNSGLDAAAMGNGTFVHNTYLPVIGYARGAEIADDKDRRKRGLVERPRVPSLENVAARQRNYISQDADWVSLVASACTAPDQIAIVPGYLKREWRHTVGGQPRRCFAYQADAKILHFFSVLSARYALKRDGWNNVAIEIWYQPGHEYNLDRMIQSVKASLDYFTKHFSPYQHGQVRIIEFPRYFGGFAQAFPNTIPYSEGVGFIAKVDRDDPEDIDYPYYVTAHEVAHQWWAHQIIGADAQGSTMLSESLAQYSALMVMKATFGAPQMKRFLRHELDMYLQGRAMEQKKELPLYRVENQGHIHYRKASLAFYALSDTIGEQAINRALAALLAKHGFKGPPYPTSLDLLAELKAVTPPDKQGLLADLFEHITLYENRALEAQGRAVDGGKQVEVTLRLTARKVRADDQGEEKEIPLDEEVEVGAVDKDGKALLLERRRLKAGEQTVTLLVPGKPEQIKKAGVDPLNKLIDRKPDDNLTAVELDAAAAPASR
jgi:ABC-2 type transport system permease protein